MEINLLKHIRLKKKDSGILLKKMPCCRKFKLSEAKILMKIFEKQKESINNLIIEKIPIFTMHI
ncbi:hypothetical protein THER_0229 [Thermodesulfovibrio sp. N1]|nr:hypothetical protein THER_0229 [Thermodesulfovibrio sp. N1]